MVPSSSWSWNRNVFLPLGENPILRPCVNPRLDEMDVFIFFIFLFLLFWVLFCFPHRLSPAEIWWMDGLKCSIYMNDAKNNFSFFHFEWYVRITVMLHVFFFFSVWIIKAYKVICLIAYHPSLVNVKGNLFI